MKELKMVVMMVGLKAVEKVELTDLMMAARLVAMMEIQMVVMMVA